MIELKWTAIRTPVKIQYIYVCTFIAKVKLEIAIILVVWALLLRERKQSCAKKVESFVNKFVQKDCIKLDYDRKKCYCWIIPVFRVYTPYACIDFSGSPTQYQAINNNLFFVPY